MQQYLLPIFIEQASAPVLHGSSVPPRSGMVRSSRTSILRSWYCCCVRTGLQSERSSTVGSGIGSSHSGMVTTARVPFSGARCSTRRSQPIRRQHSRQSSKPSPAPPRKQRRFSSHASLLVSGRPQPSSSTVSCQKLSHRRSVSCTFAACAAGTQRIESRCRHSSSASLQSAITRQDVKPP